MFVNDILVFCYTQVIDYVYYSRMLVRSQLPQSTTDALKCSDLSFEGMGKYQVVQVLDVNSDTHSAETRKEHNVVVCLHRLTNRFSLINSDVSNDQVDLFVVFTCK